jgi:pilus assembly protein CpaB
MAWEKFELIKNENLPEIKKSRLKNSKKKRTKLIELVSLSVCSFLMLIGSIFILIPNGETKDDLFSMERPKNAQRVEKKKIPIKKIVTSSEVKVVVARANIEVGTELSSDIAGISWVKRSELPENAITELSEIDMKYAQKIIPANHPITRDSIAATMPANHVAMSIPEGYRAVTIMVDEKSAVEGWVRPLVFVDVLWSTKINNKETLSIIVQNAKVISCKFPEAPKKSSRRTKKTVTEVSVPATVTLLVSTADADKIQLASTAGTLGLSLRGDTDTLASHFNGTLTVDDLLKDFRLKNNERTSFGYVRIKERNGVYKEFDVGESGQLLMREFE